AYPLEGLIGADAALDPRRRQLLSELYRTHWQGLCRYLRARFGAGPPDPEDIAQSAFARLAAAHSAQIVNPQAFLHTTAQRLMIDYRRHARHSDAYERDLTEQALEQSRYEPSPEDVLLQT